MNTSTSLTFTFTVLAWFAYLVLVQLGYGDRFDDIITAVVTIATTIFGIPVTQAAAKRIHVFAQANSIPVFGYSRTPSLSIAVRDSIAEALRNTNLEREKQAVPIAETARD